MKARAFSVMISPLLRYGILSFAFLVGTPIRSIAQTVTTINFSDITVASGTAVDATSYLESYGITLSNITPTGGTVSSGLVDIINESPDDNVSAVPGPNYLLQDVTGAPAESFTMNFSTPLSSLTFTTPANVTENLVAAWTATAYSGATEMSSASEPQEDGSNSPVTYTLDGPDITSLTISANGSGTAGIPSAPIDDFELTAIPEPSTYAVIFGVLAIGAAAVHEMRERRKIAV